MSLKICYQFCQVLYSVSMKSFNTGYLYLYSTNNINLLLTDPITAVDNWQSYLVQETKTYLTM